MSPDRQHETGTGHGSGVAWDAGSRVAVSILPIRRERNPTCERPGPGGRQGLLCVGSRGPAWRPGQPETRIHAASCAVGRRYHGLAPHVRPDPPPAVPGDRATTLPLPHREDPDVLIDVALLPAEAAVTPGRVLIVVDQIRASTTITTALDLGCSELLLAGDVETARLLARGTGRLLAGEQQAVKPDDFDLDNSPVELTRADLRGRGMILCTTNGTAVVSRLRHADHLLIGCLRNAQAVAEAAVRFAGTSGAGSTGSTGSTGDAGDSMATGGGVQVVCAGRNGRFVIDDAVAAGVIVERLLEAADAAGLEARPTDAASAAVRLRRSFPSLLAAMTESDGGTTLVEIGAPEDIAFCAEEDLSRTVPALVPGEDLRIVALSG